MHCIRAIWASPTCCAAPDASGLVVGRRERARLGDSLRHWVEENGGWLHPSLGVMHSKQYSCRGLGVVSEKGLVTDASSPVIIVPEKLFMTSDDAAPLLSPSQSGKRASAFFERQTADVRLAVLLAYERSRLAASRWKAYIEALPSGLSTGWALSPAQLEPLLPSLERELDMERQRIQREVRVARAGVDACASAVVDHIGAALGISKDDFVWAFGQVVSRSFGNQEVSALLPLVDLCNHGSGAGQPCVVKLEVSSNPLALLNALSALLWTLETGDPATAVYLSPEQGGVSIMKGFTPNPGSSEVEKQEGAALEMRLAEIQEGQSRVGVREICQDPQQASAVNQEGPPVRDNDERGCPDITANGVSRDSSSTDWGSPAESSGVVEAGPHDLLRMEEGQELLISYNFSPDVPRMSYFLNFGFVPQVVEEQ